MFGDARNSHYPPPPPTIPTPPTSFAFGVHKHDSSNIFRKSPGFNFSNCFAFNPPSAPETGGLKKNAKEQCVEVSTQTDTEFQLSLQVTPKVFEEHKVQLTRIPSPELKGVNKLMAGLKESLLSGLYSDIKFNVKGKEINAHRNILAAHSSVFVALMDSGNPVNIDDVNPDIFEDFLYFMYSGSTEKFNSENIIDMYKVAKKYQVSELCSSCVNYMVNNISVTNFCDIMTLSLQCPDEKLCNVAKEFFIQNSVEIAETTKWVVFLEENINVGNSLFIESLKLKKREV